METLEEVAMVSEWDRKTAVNVMAVMLNHNVAIQRLAVYSDGCC